MHVSDDLYLGGFYPYGLSLFSTQADNPTAQMGAGPAGRVFFREFIPLTLNNANIAALQAFTGGTPLVLTAGAGVTVAPSVNGQYLTTYKLDCPRCVTLTSSSNLSAINFLITGLDEFGRLTTQLQAGPNNNTVTTLKAFLNVISIVPTSTSANTVSVGTSDVFGLQWVVSDATMIVSAKWANVLAQNAGNLITADATSPATSSTGDPRGTYQPAGAASNGSRKLVICIHLDATACGPFASQTAAIGVNPA